VTRKPFGWEGQEVEGDWAGFTPEAEALAHQEGIMISGQAEIEQLAKAVLRR
jgi:hypothetical protein